ncbi:MAG: hypothetical protein KGL34_13855 [Gammaproteobacteria bacterium]|nr:hypothetical protein [Gammaproteobacteria bacterium]
MPTSSLRIAALALMLSIAATGVSEARGGVDQPHHSYGADPDDLGGSGDHGGREETTTGTVQTTPPSGGAQRHEAFHWYRKPEHSTHIAAPEIDGPSAVGALALLAGSLVVLRGRRGTAKI